jgi:ParB-like chromosome segregation protein Spo0J
MPPAAHSKVERVPIENLNDHPANARRGNVPVIVESVKAHGQYRPVVVNRQGSVILAGHHVVKALRKLRWKTVAVVWVDVDDQTALKILVADNRLSDLADYDDAGLAEMLLTLPDLEGSGYTREDLDALQGLGSVGGESVDAGGEKVESELVQVKVGPYHFEIGDDNYESWIELAGEVSKKQMALALRRQLEFEDEPVQKAEPSDAVFAVESGIMLAIVDLKPWAGNARRGDVGALALSLSELGQYKPVIVQKSSMRIIAGNHTVAAAESLGWSEVACVVLDVDDEKAMRINLIDNRSSDLADYDPNELSILLSGMGDLSMIGWSSADVDELLMDVASGKTSTHREGIVRAKHVSVSMGKVGFRVGPAVWKAWNRFEEIGFDYELVCQIIKKRLGFYAE